MKRKNTEEESITRCEEKVMYVIWGSSDELTMPEITMQVNKLFGCNWKPQTVSTFLARLAKKEIIKSTRHGRTFTYRALISKEEYVTKVTKRLLKMWYNSNAENMCEVIKKL